MMMKAMVTPFVIFWIGAFCHCQASAFVQPMHKTELMSKKHRTFAPRFAKVPGGNKLSQKRRKQLGIKDDEDEYDLSMALESNTDSFITKVIAGSFILVMIALLVVGVVIPATTDPGDGLCNPILNGGRC